MSLGKLTSSLEAGVSSLREWRARNFKVGYVAEALICFGRDAFGRRSFLVHWPTKEDPQFLLSFVSPLASVNESSDGGQIAKTGFWEELPFSVYSLSNGALGMDEGLIGEVLKHAWRS
ncbi:uncharacterized protein LOC107848170 isoform X1 [Capsicum annuum]|uniref:uncharacterized protein LOC107848170 isoform X1 n=1 Tax=Capsicum annuum TaxID=4072 RepID=UPI0007BF43D6|nr:uncharacterized protein LOC107848170 isoform X1 [Capsicum annuum]